MILVKYARFLEDDFEQRHVDIVPLYALSNLEIQQHVTLWTE